MQAVFDKLGEVRELANSELMRAYNGKINNIKSIASAPRPHLMPVTISAGAKLFSEISGKPEDEIQILLMNADGTRISEVISDLVTLLYVTASNETIDLINKHRERIVDNANEVILYNRRVHDRDAEIPEILALCEELSNNAKDAVFDALEIFYSYLDKPEYEREVMNIVKILTNSGLVYFKVDMHVSKPGHRSFKILNTNEYFHVVNNIQDIIELNTVSGIFNLLASRVRVFNEYNDSTYENFNELPSIIAGIFQIRRNMHRTLKHFNKVKKTVNDEAVCAEKRLAGYNTYIHRG